MVDNKNKTPEIDETILDVDPPNINEPQVPDPTDKDNQDPNPDPVVEKEVEKVEVIEPELDAEGEEEVPGDKTLPKEKPNQETPEQKEQRYKAQQTEAQIQSARNRALTEKVEEAANIAEPTNEELRAYVSTKGVEWDDLTPFEQAMAKDGLINNKRFSLVNESVQASKKIDEWATKVDTFIDETDGKPEYVTLSSHEADFRKFAMKESHRGTPIDILLSAFLHNLPPTKKVRGSLFERAGGGEKPNNPSKIEDADTAAALRITNPREYKRQLKAGNINLEV